jgi:hypothetical protein
VILVELELEKPATWEGLPLDMTLQTV